MNSDRNIAIQAPAGCGKSTIIKMLAKLLPNTMIISTTGVSALELSTEEIATRTMHSFLNVPKTEAPDEASLRFIASKNYELLNKIDHLIIDEVSMMSSIMFDYICNKMILKRRNHQLPRLILVGDVMQLPPVLNDTPIITAILKKYNGKKMFMNSEWFPKINASIQTMYRFYRQSDPELAFNVLKIAYGDHTQATLDYFNQQVIPRQTFEAQNRNYLFLTTTNDMVNKVNNKYLSTLNGEEMKYEAQMSSGFPSDKKPNEDVVTIRVGAQIMCLTNNYQQKYMNGSIGEVVEVHPDYLVMLHEGVRKTVNRTRFDIFETQLDSNGKVVNNKVGWYQQIDCKLCKATTIHKAQGKTLDRVYVSLSQRWVPASLAYVALSRVRNLKDLGLLRPLVDADVVVNQEAFDFLQ
jgi:ATP-dependent exoDNAse (exonuclease V) alpha subunit